MWGDLVTWRSKKAASDIQKQSTIVSRSSAQAKLRALTLGLCEGLWLKRILEELWRTIVFPIRIYCDIVSAINMAENTLQHNKSKHVEISKHFIKEKTEAKVIILEHIPSKDQVADILTKHVSTKIFQTLMVKLRSINIYAKLEEKCINK